MAGDRPEHIEKRPLPVENHRPFLFHDIVAKHDATPVPEKDAVVERDTEPVSEKVKVFGEGAYAHYLNMAWKMQAPEQLGEIPPLRYLSSTVKGGKPGSDILDLPQGQGQHPLHERIYALLNGSDPLPSPERPPGARPVRWQEDGTAVWITPGTREATAYGRTQVHEDTCSLMATKSVLHRQRDPEKRNPILQEDALMRRAATMGAYHPSMIYGLHGEHKFIYEDTSFSMLPNLWRSFGCNSQYVGIRCQQQDLNQIARRAVEMMGLLHSEGYDMVTRVARTTESQVVRHSRGMSILTPSETITANVINHTIPMIGFAYRYEEENRTGNELVGVILNESYVGGIQKRSLNSDEEYTYRPPRSGAGVAAERYLLEADLFALTPPDFQLHDGYDCVMQLVITERAIPRW